MIPSVAEQVRGMRNGMRTSPIGAAKRAVLRTEESLYPAWEQLLSLHGCDFWHCTVAQRSQAGFPDYCVFGVGWCAFVELKARNPITGRAGKVSVAQLRYKASIEASGNEWITFLLPDDWRAVGDWLSAKTGKFIADA